MLKNVREASGGKGVDVVYDPVGGELAQAALRSLAWHGRYLVIEFIRGTPYREATWTDRDGWFAELLVVIRAFHARGVSHGDLKSKTNIMVTDDEKPCIIDFGTVLIFAIPGTVTGVAYILAFNTPPVELTGTAVILIITMAIRAMPVGIRGGMSALSQISESLEEASVLQRASSLKTIRSVLIPLIRSTIVSSVAYSFIRSMTTVSTQSGRPAVN